MSPRRLRLRIADNIDLYRQVAVSGGEPARQALPMLAKAIEAQVEALARAERQAALGRRDPLGLITSGLSALFLVLTAGWALTHPLPGHPLWIAPFLLAALGAVAVFVRELRR